MTIPKGSLQICRMCIKLNLNRNLWNRSFEVNDTRTLEHDCFHSPHMCPPCMTKLGPKFEIYELIEHCRFNNNVNKLHFGWDILEMQLEASPLQLLRICLHVEGSVITGFILVQSPLQDPILCNDWKLLLLSP